MKCPCEECLCVPICRHKVFVELVKCSLVEAYLIDPFDFTKRPLQRVSKIEKHLKPSIWKINEDVIFNSSQRIWQLRKD